VSALAEGERLTRTTEDTRMVTMLRGSVKALDSPSSVGALDQVAHLPEAVVRRQQAVARPVVSMLTRRVRVPIR